MIKGVRSLLILVLSVVSGVVLPAEAGGTQRDSRQQLVCFYFLSPEEQSFDAAGGPGSVEVRTQSGCDWQLGNEASWITDIDPSRGVGTGTVNFTVLPNESEASRETEIFVTGKTAKIIQEGRQPVECTYEVSPTEESFDAEGGTGVVEVVAEPHCGWEAESDADWISVETESGTGSGRVDYEVEANEGEGSRAGTLTVAGKTVTIRQEGVNQGSQQGVVCQYALEPSRRLVSAAGASGTATVSATDGCQWTAKSQVSWITVSSPENGGGSGTVDYSVAPNELRRTRTGRIDIGTQALTVTQEYKREVSPASQMVASVESQEPETEVSFLSGELVHLFLRAEAGQRIWVLLEAPSLFPGVVFARPSDEVCRQTGRYVAPFSIGSTVLDNAADLFYDSAFSGDKIDFGVNNLTGLGEVVVTVKKGEWPMSLEPVQKLSLQEVNFIDEIVVTDSMTRGYALRNDDCSSESVVDAFSDILEMFGQDILHSWSDCNGYDRQLFTGTTIAQDKDASCTDSPTWNGMGGSGDLLSDAALCTLKELSSQRSGPFRLESPSIDLGIGDVRLVQEMGFLDFDPLAKRFRGYRRVRFQAPVIGEFDAISQDLTLLKRSYGTPGSLSAGCYPIVERFGLDVSTREKDQLILFKAPSFTVPTPVGPFEVTPELRYENRAPVVDSPYGYSSSTYLDPYEARGTDVYGVDQGGLYSDTWPFGRAWVSQLALGTRDASREPWVWTPPAEGEARRPDLELSKARCDEEAVPSIEVEAKARLEYPDADGVEGAMPAWLKDLSKYGVGYDVDFSVYVEPTLRAAFASQFDLYAVETYKSYEFKEPNARRSELSFLSGMEVDAGFYIHAGMNLKIVLKLPWPLDDITLIDTHPDFDVPLAEKEEGGYSTASSSVSYDTQLHWPKALNRVTTLHGHAYNGPTETEAFLQDCYANPPSADPPPEAVSEPGDPEELFEDVLYPCNICLAFDYVSVDDEGYPDGPGSDPVRVDFDLSADQFRVLMPADDNPFSPHWACDLPAKGGCMDMCAMDPVTGKLTVAVPAKDIEFDDRDGEECYWAPPEPPK